MNKLKVAHVITRMIIGGAQENTLYTVCGLMENPQYEVALVTGPTYGPEGSLEPAMEHAGVATVRIPFLRRNLNIFYDIAAFFHLYRHFKKERYHIVHTHSSKAGILGRLAAWLAGVPVVLHTIHGLPFHAYERSWKNALYVFLERRAARWCHTIITVCDEMIRQSVAAGIADESHFETIYSGLDVASFTEVDSVCRHTIRQRFGVSDDAVVVGKIGRLFDLKGHTYLLDAAQDVVQQYPETYFLCVGGGALEQELRNKAQVLGIEKNIIFVGLVPPEDIPEYIHAMDIVVHVSLREGLPRVVPQAFLCEKPVVAFDIDGARDIIRDGENGYLVEPKNTVLLAEKIGTLISNAELRAQFAQCAQRHVLRLFPKEVMVERIDALYQKLLSGRGVLSVKSK